MKICCIGNSWSSWVIGILCLFWEFQHLECCITSAEHFGEFQVLAYAFYITNSSMLFFFLFVGSTIVRCTIWVWILTQKSRNDMCWFDPIKWVTQKTNQFIRYWCIDTSTWSFIRCVFFWICCHLYHRFSRRVPQSFTACRQQDLIIS